MESIPSWLVLSVQRKISNRGRPELAIRIINWSDCTQVHKDTWTIWKILKKLSLKMLSFGPNQCTTGVCSSFVLISSNPNLVDYKRIIFKIDILGQQTWLSRQILSLTWKHSLETKGSISKCWCRTFRYEM